MGSALARKPITAANTGVCTASAALPSDINFSGIAVGTFVDVVSDGKGGNNGFLARFVLDDGRCYQAVSNQSTEFVVDGVSIWNRTIADAAMDIDMATSRERYFAATEKAEGRRVFLKLTGTNSPERNQAWLDLVQTDLPAGEEPWMPGSGRAKQ